MMHYCFLVWWSLIIQNEEKIIYCDEINTHISWSRSLSFIRSSQKPQTMAISDKILQSKAKFKYSKEKENL